LILLYRGLIGSVLEFGSVYFTNMAKTHNAGFGKGSVPGIADCIGSDGISTPNNCLGVLTGIPPLAERFAYWNLRYIVAAFCRLGHPLRERLGVLGALNIGCCTKGYSDVLSFNIVPSESFTRAYGEETYGAETCQCYGGDLFIGGAPRAIERPGMVRRAFIFYTDGSLIEGCSGFAVHQMGVGGFEHKIQNPAGVFTTKLSALFNALRHIAEVIGLPEGCLFLTDSLNSIRPLSSSDFQSLARPALMKAWQQNRTLQILVGSPILFFQM
jgi:hypothetical protein